MGSSWRSAGLRSMGRATAVTAAAATTVGLAFGAPSTASTDAEARYASLDALPTAAMDVEDIERTAIELADGLEAVPVSAEQHDVACPLDRLRVSWEEPVGYERGALVTPVGPEPGPDTRSVNGVVVCDGSTYAFMGFEAAYNGAFGWRVTAVPVFDEHGAHEPEPLDLRVLDELRPDLGSLAGLGPVDAYAPYQPQRLCHAVPKPGAVALAKLLLDAYPGTTNYGIARGCAVGPRSEHKEGRAFDWGADVHDPEQAAAVEDLLRRLLATDTDGNEHALARRLGIMYLIWDGHIWSSYRASEGWRPYVGPSAHTDHVHISLSWDGAMGRTSLWRVALEGIDLGDVPIGVPGALPPHADAAAHDGLDLRTPVLEEQAARAAAGGGRAGDQGAADDRDRSRQQDGGTVDDGGTVADDGGEPSPGSATGTVDEAADAVGDTVGDAVGDTVGDPVEDATEPVDDTTEPVDDATEDPVDRVTDPVGDDVGEPVGGALP